MQKIITTGLLTTVALFSFGQKDVDKIINAKEVARIETILSSNEMQGRKEFSPGIEKAANYISSEFKAAGLQVLDGSDNYKQEFVMVRPKFISASATLDGVALDQRNVMVITTKEFLKID